MVAGGESRDTAHAEVSVFDGQSWTEFPSLSVARHGTGLAVDCNCNQIVIASGSPIEGGPTGNEPGVDERNGGLQSTEHFFPGGNDQICANVFTECAEPEPAGARWQVMGVPDVPNFSEQSSACFVMGSNGKAYFIGGFAKEPLCVYDPTLRQFECQTENFPKRTHHR